MVRVGWDLAGPNQKCDVVGLEFMQSPSPVRSMRVFMCSHISSRVRASLTWKGGLRQTHANAQRTLSLGEVALLQRNSASHSKSAEPLNPERTEDGSQSAASCYKPQPEQKNPTRPNTRLCFAMLGGRPSRRLLPLLLILGETCCCRDCSVFYRWFWGLGFRGFVAT